jgi:hypothetical protein
VAACGVAVGVGHEPPGQAGQLLVQAGLVAFDGEDPVRTPLGEVGDVVTLAVQCVGGDHGTVEVADLVEQWTEAGDLVGFGVDVGAGEDRAAVVLGGGEDVPGGAVAAA